MSTLLTTAALLLAAQLTALAQPVATQPPAAPAPTVQAAAIGPYRVLRTFEIGGEGGWDLLRVDGAAHRLYVPRSTRVMVIDTESGKVVGEVAGTSGVHDVAIVPEIGKGFTTNGKTDDVTVFDLKTLAAERTIKAGKGPDAAIYEPTTKRVFVFNGKSNDATVISTVDFSVVGTIALGGKPELAVADGGIVFLNLEDTSEVLRLNAASMKVEKRIPLSPGEEPTGLAFDAAHRRLFAACANEKMIALDADKGVVLAAVPIGKGVDGAAFDPQGSFAFSSNGEGTLTVVRTLETDGLKPFTVVQTLSTARGARTITIDEKSHTLYLPTAEFEAPKPETKTDGKPDAKPDARPARPKMKPGTFKILVVGR